MAIATNAHRTMDLIDVIGTVHGAISLNFEKYAEKVNDGLFGDALELLDQQHGLVQQAAFLLTELSDASSVEAEPAFDPDQLDLPILASSGSIGGLAFTIGEGDQIRPIDADSAVAAPHREDRQREAPGALVSNDVTAFVANRLFGEAYGVDWAYSTEGEAGREWWSMGRIKHAYRQQFGDAAYMAEFGAPFGSVPEAPAQTDVDLMRAEQRIRELESTLQRERTEERASAATLIGDNRRLRADVAELSNALRETRDTVDRLKVTLAETEQARVIARGDLETLQGAAQVTPPNHFASSLLLSDTEACAKVLQVLVAELAERGEGAEAAVLADAQEIVLRGTFGAAASRGVQPTPDPVVDEPAPQTFPAVAEGDMALFEHFAVNPGPDAQVVVGLLGTDSVLAWTMAGSVADGSFTTFRQRLQMFADTEAAVALARAGAQ